MAGRCKECFVQSKATSEGDDEASVKRAVIADTASSDNYFINSRIIVTDTNRLEPSQEEVVVRALVRTADLCT